MFSPALKPIDVARLKIGEFFVRTSEARVSKVYVQPAWMDSEIHAQAIAKGQESVAGARQMLRAFKDSRKEVPPPPQLLQVQILEQEMPDEKTTSSPDSSNEQERNRSSIAAIQSDVSPDSGIGASSDVRSRYEKPNDVDTSRKPPERDTEAMWKEKYEALKKEFDKLVDELAAHQQHEFESGYDIEPARRRVHNGALDPKDMDALLAALVRHAKKDATILQFLRDVPEIQVKRVRRTLEMSATETPGRIAVLITEKFFDSPQNSGQVTKEFKRRGWFSVKTSNAAVLRPLADIAEMGFLTRDGSNYQAVPGMKVNIVEA